MVYYPGEPNIEIPNRSDAMIISIKGIETTVIGVIDPDYASNTISYDVFSDISFSFYLAYSNY